LAARQSYNNGVTLALEGTCNLRSWLATLDG
jgi:hypothetical protein